MTSRSLTLMLLAALLLASPACRAIHDVAVGVGIVSATAPDTAQVDVNADNDAVYERACTVLAARGSVGLSEPEAGRILAEVADASVAVTVRPRGDVIRVRVTVRKRRSDEPDLHLAETLARDVSRPYL